MTIVDIDENLLIDGEKVSSSLTEGKYSLRIESST